MIGNPYKGVVQDPILEDTADVLVLDASGVANSVDYTVPTGRGKVQAIGIYVASTTIADIAGITITVSASGKTLFNQSPGIKHSPLFTNSRIITIGQVDENVPISIQGQGAANNNVKVYVVFFFYDVYLTTLQPTAMPLVRTGQP